MNDLMNSYLTLALPGTLIAAASYQDASLWERAAERWGIGLVGLGLFIALAWLNEKKEVKREKERQDRDAAAQKERTELLSENNRLQSALLDHLVSHARILENLVKDGNKAANDQAQEMKNLSRKLHNKPCAIPRQDESDS